MHNTLVMKIEVQTVTEWQSNIKNTREEVMVCIGLLKAQELIQEAAFLSPIDS